MYPGAAEKLEQAETQLSHSGRTGRFGGPMDRRPHDKDNQLLKICRDSAKMSVEQIKGISSQVTPDTGRHCIWLAVCFGHFRAFRTVMHQFHARPG